MIFLSAAEGQRPSNYSSCCWIFRFKNSCNLSLSLYFCLWPKAIDRYLPSPTYLCLPTDLHLPIYVYLPTSTYLLTYAYLPTSTYLLTYAYLSMSTYLHQHTYLPILNILTFDNLPTYTNLCPTYLPAYINTPTYLCSLTNPCQPTIIYLPTCTNP